MYYNRPPKRRGAKWALIAFAVLMAAALLLILALVVNEMDRPIINGITQTARLIIH